MNCKTKSFMRRRKAFTLIELLIVIAIIGILFIVLVSKVDFATDKAKAAGVQTDFRSFQLAIETVARENAGFNTFGWDTGDLNANGKKDVYDEGDVNKDGIKDAGEVWTGHKVPGETFTKVFTLVKPGTDFATVGYDSEAISKLEAVINANLDPKLHITIATDGTITMANGAQDPWKTEYHGYYITNATVDKKDRGAIVMYSNGANQKWGSAHAIANGVVTVNVPENNVYGKDDYSVAVTYTYINGYGEVKTLTTGFSNNQGGGQAGSEGTFAPGIDNPGYQEPDAPEIDVTQSEYGFYFNKPYSLIGDGFGGHLILKEDGGVEIFSQEVGGAPVLLSYSISSPFVWSIDENIITIEAIYDSLNVKLTFDKATKSFMGVDDPTLLLTESDVPYNDVYVNTIYYSYDEDEIPSVKYDVDKNLVDLNGNIILSNEVFYIKDHLLYVLNGYVTGPSHYIAGYVSMDGKDIYLDVDYMILSVTPPEKFSPYKDMKAGLYQYGGGFISWDELLAGGYVYVNNGTFYTTTCDDGDFNVNDHPNIDFFDGILLLPNDGSITRLGETGYVNGKKVVTKIAFAGLVNLDRVILPPSVSIIDNGAFAGILNGDITSVGPYGYGCSVELSYNVKEIGFAAFCLTTLEEVYIPDSVTHIGDSAFWGDATINYMWIPKSVEYIHGNALAPLYGVDIDDNNEYYQMIDGCLVELNTGTIITANENSTIPSDSFITTIGSYAFNEVSTPSYLYCDENIKCVESRAFAFSAGLTYISFNSDELVFGNKVFDGCSTIQKIVFFSETPAQIESDTFDCQNSDMRIYVLPECVEIYKAAWPQYADIIVANEK